MRNVMIALALCLAPTTALAGTIENSVGNTVIIRTADGAHIELRARADGTYTRRLPDGTSIAGTWSNDAGRFCETPTGGAQACADVVDGKNVGDTWTVSGSDGATVTISIVAGQ